MLVYGRNVARDLLKKGKNIRKIIIQDSFDDKEIISLIEKSNLRVETKTKREIDNLCSGVHQGIILDIPDYQYSELNELLDEEIIVILDHLEDPHNLGAIIRTCEAAGVYSIIIPKDRGVSVNSTVMKTSAGALEHVNIAMVNNLNKTIDDFKKNGFFVYGADMNGHNYKDLDFSEKVLLVIGNEGKGMARLVREACDEIVSIPQYGKINSLNASVAAGIIVYGIVNR